MNRRTLLHRTMTAALTATLVGTMTFACAAENHESASPDFGRLDANRDGYISRDEARELGGFDKAFSEADDNRDGKLDAAEFTKAQSIQDREVVSQFFDDSVITAKVKAALLKDLRTKSFAVSVETRKGTVMLSGFVDDEGQVKRAAEIAAAVQGVTSVKNSLAVKS